MLTVRLQFILSQNIQKHIDAVHEGMKTYNCQQCYYSASKINSFWTLINARHEGKGLHKCAHCDYRVSHPDNLCAHVNEVHQRINPLVTNAHYSVHPSNISLPCLRLKQPNNKIQFNIIWYYLKCILIKILVVLMEYFICYKCNRTVKKNICLLKSDFSQFLNMSSNGRHDRSEKFICTQGTCTKSYYQFRSQSMKHKHDSYHPKIVSLYATKSLQQPWTSIILKNVWNQDNLALAVNETQTILIANLEVHKKVIVKLQQK